MSLTVIAVPTPPDGVLHTTVIDVATFREHRPEFADALTYPADVIQLYLDTGATMLNPQRWKSALRVGIELFTCHMLALQQYASRSGGGIPGAGVGVVQSKGVSKVSVSYDTTLGAMEGGGPWNLTLYGTQFLWWCKILGSGGTEMLGAGYRGAMEGRVWTWATGVLSRWGS